MEITLLLSIFRFERLEWAIETGIVPPTINYETPDPECDLDYTPNVKREAKIDTVLTDNLGFGGHNAALVFKRHGAS